jgi:hypothetical protein
MTIPAGETYEPAASKNSPLSPCTKAPAVQHDSLSQKHSHKHRHHRCGSMPCLPPRTPCHASDAASDAANNTKLHVHPQWATHWQWVDQHCMHHVLLYAAELLDRPKAATWPGSIVLHPHKPTLCSQHLPMPSLDAGSLCHPITAKQVRMQACTQPITPMQRSPRMQHSLHHGHTKQSIR